jgi:signal transduction histidine kinase
LQLLKTDHSNTIIQAFTDITDRVQSEQKIRTLASELTTAEQEERQNISQMLHDDLQQRIFAIKLQIATLQSGKQAVDFKQLLNSLDEAIAITRNLSMELSPAILQGEGLTEALVWLAAHVHEQYGLEVKVNANGVDTHFEDALRILLFQAVREALFNVVKHAGVLKASITLKPMDTYIRLIVSDEGDGFDERKLDDEPHKLSGLLHFQTRLNLMGCRLVIQSQPNHGTEVIIDIVPKR